MKKVRFNMLYLEWNHDKTDYSVWDADRIRSAFRDGHGTLDDFKRYVRENQHVCFEAVEVAP